MQQVINESADVSSDVLEIIKLAFALPPSGPGKVKVVFTKSWFSPISWIIRWCLPRTRFKLALSSHCLACIGDEMYDVDFKSGVQRVSAIAAMKGRTIVRTVEYNVPDVASAIGFAESQIGTKYDIKGALGVGIDPERDWSDDTRWFCYEFTAAILQAGGRDVFGRLDHITETALLAIKA